MAFTKTMSVANQQAKADLLNRTAYKTGGKKLAAILWKPVVIPDSAYNPNKGGQIIQVDFTVVDEQAAGLSMGPHKITVEARYNYIDAWLDDEEPIKPQHLMSVPLNSEHGKPEEQNRIVEQYKNEINEMLEGLAAQGAITL